MDVVNRANTVAFTTKDGSVIREILAHRNSGLRLQSLAEATVPPGSSTQAHYHPRAEEIYYILAGTAEVCVGPDRQVVGTGDGIAIPPGAPHQIRNAGSDDLVFLCCCAPAYEHDDTILLPTMLG